MTVLLWKRCIWLIALGPGVYAVQLLWLLIAGRMTNAMVRADYTALTAIIYICVAAACVRWKWSGRWLCGALAVGFGSAYTAVYLARSSNAVEASIRFLASGVPLMLPWILIMFLARPLAEHLLVPQKVVMHEP